MGSHRDWYRQSAGQYEARAYLKRISTVIESHSFSSRTANRSFRPCAISSLRHPLLCGWVCCGWGRVAAILAVLTVLGMPSLYASQTTPTIEWATPQAVVSGTELSAAQLDATAWVPGTTTSVPGTFVYSLAAGTIPAIGLDTLTVVFTPTDSVDYATATATVTLTVASFTLSLNGASTQTVAAGGAATFNLTVSPVGSTTLFTAVTFTVSGLPPGATSTFSPTLVPAGNPATGVHLVIQTSNSSAALITEPRGYAPGSPGASTVPTIQLAALLSSTHPARQGSLPFAPFGFGLVACGVFCGFRQFKVLRRGFAMVALAGITMVLAGCGGGLAVGPTASAGSYVVTVTASSGAQRASTSLTLVVR